MRKILSERNLVVILFLVALVVFSLAQEDARKMEKMYLDSKPAASTILPAAGPAAAKTAIVHTVQAASRTLQ